MWKTIYEYCFMIILDCDLYRLFNQRRSNAIFLITGMYAYWPECYCFHYFINFVYNMGLHIHYVSNYFIVDYGYKIQFLDKVFMVSHDMNQIMLVAAWNKEIPKRLPCNIFYLAEVGIIFVANYYVH